MKHIKSALALIIAFAITMVTIPTDLWEDFVVTAEAATVTSAEFDTLLSSDSTYYAIDSAEDWKIFAGWCYNPTNPNRWLTGVTIKLTADIELGLSIPTVDDFKGIFNGQGHRIFIKDGSYFAISDNNTGTATGPDLGLFRNIIGGSVSNVVVELEGALYNGITATSYNTNTNEANNSGVICGRLSDGGKISNCAVMSESDTVTSTYIFRRYSCSPYATIGAICGYIDDNCTVDGCYSDIDINGYLCSNDCYMYIGGIAGYMAANSTITNCNVFYSTIYGYHSYPNNGGMRLVLGAIAGAAANQTNISSCVAKSIAMYCYDVSETTVTPSAISYNSSGCFMGAVAGYFGATTATGSNYSTVTFNGLSSSLVTNYTGRVGEASAATASALGTSYWITTKAGYPNLKWMVTEGPTVSVNTISGDSIAFTPSFADYNGDEKYSSGADSLWAYSASIPVKGAMPTPEGATITTSSAQTLVSGVVVSNNNTATNNTAKTYYSGASYQFYAILTGNNLAENEQVTWNATVNNVDYSSNIDDNGYLTIPDSFTGFITIKATYTSVTGTLKTSDLTISVTSFANSISIAAPDPVDNSITVTSVAKGEKLAIGATLYGSSSFTNKIISWQVTGRASNGTTTSVSSSINASGVLSIDPNETAYKLVVTGTVLGTVTSNKLEFLVVNAPSAELILTETSAPVSSGSKIINENNTLGLTAVITAPDAYVLTSTLWAVEGELLGSFSSDEDDQTIFTPTETSAGMIQVTKVYTKTTGTAPDITTETKTYMATINLAVNSVTSIAVVKNTSGAESDTKAITSEIYVATESSSYRLTINGNNTTYYWYAISASNSTRPDVGWIRYSLVYNNGSGITISEADNGKYLWVYTTNNTEGTKAASDDIVFTIDIPLTGSEELAVLSGSIDTVGTESQTIVKKGIYTVAADCTILGGAEVSISSLLSGDILAAGTISITSWAIKSKYGGSRSRFLTEGTGTGIKGDITPTPTILPRTGETISEGQAFTIQVPAGATVYYTITPDGNATTLADPNPDLYESDGRTLLYTSDSTITYPTGSSYFEIRAIACIDGKDDSAIDTVRFTTQNFQSPNVPTLLLGESKLAYSSTSTYEDGALINFEHANLNLGTVYYTTTGSAPSSSNGLVYDPSKTQYLPTNRTSVTIKAIYYNNTTGLTSEVVTYVVKIRQIFDTPAVSIQPNTSIKPGQLLYFTLSTATIAQLYEINNTIKLITYPIELDESNNLDTGYTVDPATKPLPGTDYITYEVDIDNDLSLPDIYYLIGDGDVSDTGLVYQYGIRKVIRSYETVEGAIEVNRTVYYTNPNAVSLKGNIEETIKVQAMTVATTDTYDSSKITTFTYTVRSSVKAPVIFPTTSSESPTLIQVGSKIALDTDTADAQIFYTIDGSKPKVELQEVTTNGLTVLTWIPLTTSTLEYITNDPIVIENDDQLIVTINAIAVSSDDTLESSTIVSFRYEVEELKQASLPKSSPITSDDNITQLTNGSKIALTSITLNSQIFYTTNGEMPDYEARLEWNALKSSADNFGNLLYAELVDDLGAFLYAKISDGSGGYQEVPGVDVIAVADKIYEPATLIYNIQTGILMEADSQNPLFMITAITREKSTPAKYAVSDAVSFTYQLAQTGAPTATPNTTSNSITTISPNSPISLSTATANATIYYTTNNTLPVVGGSSTYVYSVANGIIMPESVTTFFTIRAIAVADGYQNSDAVLYTYQPPAPVQAVYTSPSDSSSVSKNTEITLKCSTKDANIFYLVFDSSPKSSVVPEPYTDQIFDTNSPIVISEETWIRAVAERDGVKSVVATYHYTVADQISALTSSLKNGSVVYKGTRIILNAEGTIAYTKDGSDPKDKENDEVLYGNTIVIDADYGDTVTIRAYAYETDYTSSETASFTYTVCEKEEYIQAAPVSGSILSQGSVVSLTTAITNGTIFYTLNGNSPVVENSHRGSGSYSWSSGSDITFEGGNIVVSGTPGSTVTIKATVAAEGSDGGTDQVFTYTLAEQTSAPTASIPSGAIVLDDATVTLTVDQGSIYYTTDGSDPTTSSRLYTAPISAGYSMVLKAIAVSSGKAPSNIVEYIYTLAGQTAAPSFSITGGEIELGTKIALSSSTNGATIYYSTDGTDPSADNLQKLFTYTGSIVVTRPVTIKAISIKTGERTSVANTATYTVVEPVTPEPENSESEPSNVTTTDRLTSRRTYSNQNIGPSFTDIILTDSLFNAIVSAEENIIPENINLVVKESQTLSTDKKAISSLLGYEIVSMYDITLEQSGAEIQPNGEIEIGIPIPADYQNGIVVVCCIYDDGTAEAYPTRRSGGIAYVVTNHLSKYAVTVPYVESQNDMNWAVIVTVCLCIGAVLVMGTVLIIITRKKRKFPPEDKK